MIYERWRCTYEREFYNYFDNINVPNEEHQQHFDMTF